MAEKTFLGNTETRDLYKKSALDLYKKILEYEALAVQYFGRSTLRRLGKNVLGSTTWADMPAAISTLDDEARRSLLFLGQQSQASSFITLAKFLERQEQDINSLVRSVAAKKDEVAQVTSWISAISRSVERDHRDVRQKLGHDHFESGSWFLDNPQVKTWRNWTEDHQCLWLKGGVGSGKSSLASILVEHLMRQPDGLVAFFYCSRKADKNRTYIYYFALSFFCSYRCILYWC